MIRQTPGLMNADGTGAHNVTNSEAFDGWPEWSPDGKRLAFAPDFQCNVLAGIPPGAP